MNVATAVNFSSLPQMLIVVDERGYDVEIRLQGYEWKWIE